ncbi:MAG TPA: shikimate kinase [Flavobacteriales bacterium]|nr:shikimate kinase [Flavobacteriales bacterium]
MVYLIGFMGVGKTTLAKLLAEQLQLPFLDTDLEIEQQEKRSIAEIFKKEGKLYFRMLETELLKQYNRKGIVACGGGLAIHNNNMELINSNGISIYLKASANHLYNQLKDNKQSRPLIANITNEELKLYLKKELKNRSSFYELAQHTILVDDKNKAEILREINALIRTL